VCRQYPFLLVLDDSAITLAGDDYFVETCDIRFLSWHTPSKKENHPDKVNPNPSQKPDRFRAPSIIVRFL
jgi:hypothetical protein